MASRIPRYLHRDWHQIKFTVMMGVLIAKADYYPEVKSTLIDSTGKYLVECTQNIFWASGIPPRFTATTKSSYYHDSNMLGVVIESVRMYLLNTH